MNYCSHRGIVRQVDMRIDQCITPDADAGHDTDMDTSAAIVADKCSQLVAPGVYQRTADINPDVLSVKTPVCGDGSGAKRAARANDRIAGIIHVKLGTFPDVRFLDFRTETDHAIRADMGVSPHERTVTDYGIFTKIDGSADDGVFKYPYTFRDNDFTIDDSMSLV
jgi:hypothetical protein